MAKFRCVCGHVISTSGGIPNHDEWRAISDIALDEVTDSDAARDLLGRMVIFYRCPASDHLWIFWDGFDAPPRIYGPELLPEGWA
jgi:hypothetical protein